MNPLQARITRRSLRGAWLLPVALLAACAVGPDYKVPPLALPAGFKEGGADWQVARPADAQPRGAWWRVFDDPDLDALEDQVALANLDVRIAAERWQQAEALVRQARAAYWPTLSASAAATRSRNATQASVGGTVVSGPVALSNVDTLSLSASWEADLWGKIRRGVEADVAAAQASRATLASTRLSLQAQLAESYLALRQADVQYALLDESVAAYERSLELTRNRYAGGVVSRVDVAQATTQLETTRAQRIDVGIARAQYEHAIAVLVGEAPADFALPPRAPQAPLPAPPPVAAAVPSTLLERRPDVAAAERSAAQANAQIGVAEAAFFPDLALGASLGYRSSTLSNLVSLPNRIWSVGPTLAATLFDAGARSAAKAQAEAGYAIAADTYRQTVLAAMQGVEDNLAALRLLAAEATVERAAVAAAEDTLALTINQYKAGTISYLNVITAQTAELSSKESYLNLQGRQLTATVELIKALGGGWDRDQPESQPPAAAR